MMTAASPLDPYSTAANAWRPQQDYHTAGDDNNDDDLQRLMDALSPEDQACIRMLLRGTKAPQAPGNIPYTGQQLSSTLFDSGDLSPESTTASSSSCNDLTPQPMLAVPSSIIDACNTIINNNQSPASPSSCCCSPAAPSLPHKADATGMSLTARRRKARRQNRVASCSRSPAVNDAEGYSTPNSPVSCVSEVTTAAPTTTAAMPPLSGPTTMMIRNVPKRYTQRMLIQELTGRGFEGTFDFFYLPTDISSGRNLGYAFVNFLTPALAATFKSVFHKLQLPGSGSLSTFGDAAGANNNCLSISVAVVQGLKRNLDNLVRNASVHRIKNPEYLPLVVDPVHGCLAPYMVPPHAGHKPQQQARHGVARLPSPSLSPAVEQQQQQQGGRRRSSEKHHHRQGKQSNTQAVQNAPSVLLQPIPTSPSFAYYPTLFDCQQQPQQ
ncbi:hypothetical protein FOZ63_026622 [Perkinsus olseni]|uniref:Mei2-like C-terminal RNA recognition motif domain-containing protein n=1 Tax=Perkinsus olseni TaxID=32597 RepID=A0A7J6TLD4_PEROL|nr:hypothetical protein FOZ63_026622 [Perkinsus olseni]